MIDLKAIREAAEAANKLEELSLDQLVDYLNTVPTEVVIALLGRLEAAEKDAARYRWMREQDGFTLDRLMGHCETVLDVDEAVDAAMGEQK